MNLISISYCKIAVYTFLKCNLISGIILKFSALAFNRLIYHPRFSLIRAVYGLDTGLMPLTRFDVTVYGPALKRKTVGWWFRIGYFGTQAGSVGSTQQSTSQFVAITAKSLKSTLQSSFKSPASVYRHGCFGIKRNACHSPCGLIPCPTIQPKEFISYAYLKVQPLAGSMRVLRLILLPAPVGSNKVARTNPHLFSATPTIWPASLMEKAQL
jgi:hypothetical protein